MEKRVTAVEKGLDPFRRSQLTGLSDGIIDLTDKKRRL
jgi:hypothetical protein